MAKQEIAFANGRIGNIVFYRLNGTGYARTAPRKYKQSKATKQSAKDFGRAAQLSKYLRYSLRSALTDYKNREIIYKMNAALLKWLRQERPDDVNSSIDTVEFNDKSEFSSRFRKELLVDFNTKGKVMINIPRLKIPDDIAAPSNTTSVRLDIAIAGCMLKEPQPTETASTSIKILYKDGSITAAVEKELKFNCKAGSINVVAVSLHYFIKEEGHETEVINDRWTPAAIIAAVIG